MPGYQENDLFIAAVGGSTEGIEAIKHFLSSIHGNENCCVVIIPDQADGVPENLLSLLRNHCEWEVRDIYDGLEPVKSMVYVAPPEENFEFCNGRFQIIRSPLNPKHSSGDIFFKSLAVEKEYMAIGILISGHSDHSREGIKAITRNNGYVICQIPSSAYFRCLPPTFMDTAKCDIILHSNDIFKEIKQYINNSRIIKLSEKIEITRNESERQIIRWLENKTGTNFSRYKSSTISRRMKKRMDVLGMNNIENYLSYIHNTPKELEDLFTAVLIGETEFFRDKESFRALKEILKKKILKNRQEKNYRIWCVGCGTGEEAYSIAMLLLDLKEKEQFNFQIFASEIQERAIQIARNGIFSENKVENVPEEFREKYFNKIPGGYEIKRRVRRHIMFTRHDVTDDPPFIRLDLIVCRNLLIYFNAGLQQETIKLFSYALNPQGLLLLGKSDSINIDHSEFFKYADAVHNIYEKPASIPLQFFRRKIKHLKKSARSPLSLASLPGETGVENEAEKLLPIIRETLTKTIEHPFLFIDEKNVIMEMHRDMKNFMEPAGEWMKSDVLSVIHPELRPAISILLGKVRNREKPGSTRIIRLMISGNEQLIRIKIKPLVYFNGMHRYYLLLFEFVQEKENLKTQRKNNPGAGSDELKIRELENELSLNKNELHAVSEQVEAANREFQSLYEEIQSANEEYLAANMALEITNEELLSANEELSRAVQELRKSNEALSLKESELKTLYEKLEESEKRFRYLADVAPVMIWMIGTDNKGNYFNKKWQEFTGMNLDKLTDPERMEYVHPDDVEDFLSSFRKAIENRIEIVAEFRMKGSSGDFQWFQMRGIPRYSPSGEYLGYIGANTNIDEIKTLEEKKDEFMSIAGHELKTPMTASLAYLELLYEEIRSSGNEKLKQYILKMSNSMQKMHNLVVDLLEVSRIEADKLNLNLEEMLFDEMVYDFVEDFRAIAPDRKIRITGKTGKKIIGDRNRLEQVINNLLTNADKFSPQNEEIQIQLGSVENFVKMNVKDKGIGIDKSHHKKIFKRYYQIGSEKFKSGMGVGLFITKEIVERHGGTIRIRSQEGKGSAFMVEIPAMK
jgi:PAS domain S-box-containing protein